MAGSVFLAIFLFVPGIVCVVIFAPRRGLGQSLGLCVNPAALCKEDESHKFSEKKGGLFS